MHLAGNGLREALRMFRRSPSFSATAVAVAVVLSVGASLLIRAAIALRAVDPGF